MISLWYLNTDEVDQMLVNEVFDRMPISIQKRTKAYKFEKDQRLHLFGRWMIATHFKKNGLDFDWGNLLFSEWGKPFIKDGIDFNVSHSGAYVFSAFSSSPIGVDVEEEKNLDWQELCMHFHPDEQQYLFNQNSASEFYRLWTRKEAFLKANGKGITNDLPNYDVRSDEVRDNNKTWYLTDMDLLDNYKVAICTDRQDKNISIKEISHKDISFYSSL